MVQPAQWIIRPCAYKHFLSMAELTGVNGRLLTNAIDYRLTHSAHSKKLSKRDVLEEEPKVHGANLLFLNKNCNEKGQQSIGVFQVARPIHHLISVAPLKSLSPKIWDSRWNFVATCMCSRTRDTPGGISPPPSCRRTSQKSCRRDKG